MNQSQLEGIRKKSSAFYSAIEHGKRKERGGYNNGIDRKSRKH